MALEDKKLPIEYRSIDTDAYNFYRKKEGGDGLLKFFLFAILAISLFVFVIAIFSTALKEDPEGIAGPLYLVTGIIVSALVLIFAFAMMVSKNKNLTNSSHIFVFKQDPGKFKIVDNFSSSSVSVSGAIDTTKQQVDEDGNAIFYAEEVFDDEDNIFVIEEASTLLKKEKSLTYGDLAASINTALESFGVTGDLAINLLASMAFSKLIDVTNVLDVVPLLFKALGNPHYVIHYHAGETLTSQKVLYNVFEYAKTHPNDPVFMLIDEIPSKEYLNYLRPLYRYIDDLNGDYYITINGAMVHIPSNVYFMSAISKKDKIFDVSRRYLRYISILKSDYKINTETENERKPFAFNNTQLANARRNAMDSCSVEETTYKKLDMMFALANEANGYVLQNKIQRKIEEFCAVLLSYDVSEDDAIDRCLAYNVIAATVISSDPTKLMKDCNLSTLLDNEFGQDKMKLTKAMIKEYLSLFNSKGERQND